MEVLIPEHLKGIITQRLEDDGIVPKIRDKITASLRKAAKELKTGERQDEIYLESLDGLPEIERKIFVILYNYLRKKGLNTSAENLLEESGVEAPEDDGSLPTLTDLMKFMMDG